jgi:acyl carrier protein
VTVPSNFDEIREIVRTKVLFEGLELSDLGFSLDDVRDDTHLVGDEGLALDSVDALEILSLLQKTFGIEIGKIDKKVLADHLSTLSTLVAFVASHRQSVVA